MKKRDDLTVQDRLRAACAGVLGAGAALANGSGVRMEGLEERRLLAWQADPGFNGAGWVAERFGGSGTDKAAFNAVAVQADGKVLALAQVQQGSTFRLVLARYLSSGAPDQDFAGDGTLELPFESSTRGKDAGTMELMGDGRIVVAAAGDVEGVRTTRVFRFENDGSLDDSFGAGGVAALPDSHTLTVNDLALLPGGELLLVGGRVTGSGDTDRAIVRLAGDGTPDGGFGSGGILVTPYVKASDPTIQVADAYERVTLTPDGKMLLTFTVQGASARQWHGLNGDGTVAAGLGWSQIHAEGELLVQRDGKILVTGAGGRLDANRLTEAGATDRTYTGDGWQAIVDTGDRIESAVLQPDGRLVLVGRIGSGLVAARFNPTGSLDHTIGVGARALVDPNPSAVETVTAVAVSPDGTIVLAGYSEEGSALLVRLAPAPLPAPGASVIGGVLTVVGTGGDDRIVVSGNSVSLNGQSFSVSGSFQAVAVYGGEGNDWISVGASTGVTSVNVFGGPGDDRFDASRIEDLFDGGPGFDRFYDGSPASPVHFEYRYDTLWNVEEAVAGTLSGQVTYNGAPMPGQWVYMDLNENGAFDDGEPSAVTNPSGYYEITDAPPGFCLVNVVPSAGYRLYRPKSYIDGVETTVLSQQRTTQDLSLLQNPGISGVVFHDLDLDGVRDTGEAGVAGLRVFLDKDGDGLFDAGETSTFTDAQGGYSFLDLAPGWYRVWADGGSEWLGQPRKRGAGNFVDLSAESGIVGGIDPWVVRPVRVSGVVYEDRNGNGVRDAGEPGVAGRPMVLDVNRDGKGTLDYPTWWNGDTVIYTDAEGRFDFVDMPKAYSLFVYAAGGEHGGEIEFMSPATGRAELDLAAGPVSGLEFGVRVRRDVVVNVTGDADGDGVAEAGEAGVSGATVWLDLDDDGALDANEPKRVTGASGEVAFEGLADGTYRVRIIPPAGWAVGGASNDPAVIGAGVVAERSILLAPNAPSVVGFVFNDTDADGVRDAGEGALVNLGVLLDLDGNGRAGNGEPMVRTDANGRYEFAGLTPGAYAVRVMRPGSRWAVTTPGGGVIGAELEDGDVITGDFGLVETASVSGRIWEDRNRNGVLDGKETGLSGVTLWLDDDGDGVQDAGEAVITSGAKGKYTFNNVAPGEHRLGVVLGTGTVVTKGLGTFPVASGTAAEGPGVGLVQLGSIRGRVIEDAGRERVVDRGDKGIAGRVVFLDLDWDERLDAGEPRTRTDAKGNYVFEDVVVGDYVVDAVLPAGWRWTSGSAPVAVKPGEREQAASLLQTRRAKVSGVVYRDDNGNGGRGGREPSMLGWTVWLDVDNDGVLDKSEPRALNTRDGFVLESVPPGKYVLRVRMEKGYKVTKGGSAAQKLNLGAGKVVERVMFGVRPIGGEG